MSTEIQRKETSVGTVQNADGTTTRKVTVEETETTRVPSKDSVSVRTVKTADGSTVQDVKIDDGDDKSTVVITNK